MTLLDLGNSDRRCEAPQGGAIKIPDLRNSDRRCVAPQGGAITRFPATKVKSHEGDGQRGAETHRRAGRTGQRTPPSRFP